MCNRGVVGTLLFILGAILVVAAIGAPYLVQKLLRQVSEEEEDYTACNDSTRRPYACAFL